MEQDPFSNFSKGAVSCTYQLIEPIGDHKRRGRWGLVLVLTWMLVWAGLFVALWHHWVLLVIAFAPWVDGRWFFRWLFPCRVTGLLTVANERMAFHRDGDGPWSADLRRLQRMTVAPSIPMDFVSKGGRRLRALRLELREGEKVHVYHVLNAMHLTAEDRRHFMSVPPTLLVTLRTLRDQFGVRLVGPDGEETDVV